MPLTFRHISVTSILLLLFNVTSHGQNDSSKIFRHYKGKLECPISKYNNQTDFTKKIVEPAPSIELHFKRTKTEDVFASFDGRVIAITDFGDSRYGVFTKYGEYYINYVGLTKPDLKEGEFIHARQKISSIARDSIEGYQLIICLSKHGKYLDPQNWFKL